MRIYNYTYYKLRVFFTQLNPDLAGFLAMMAMCWLFLINSFAILGLIVVKNPGLSYGYSKVVAVIFSLSIILIHSLYFNRKRALSILKENKKEGMLQNVLGSIGVLLYVILSFYFLFQFTVPCVTGIVPH